MRVVDLFVAAAALLLLSPLIALISLLVAITSPGPVIFRQDRVGRGGHTFSVLKFRTMIDGTHDEVLADPRMRRKYEENGFKLEGDDPRITKVGRWLRRTSLDELPQLVNVVRGEMSSVGVRPLLPYELAQRPPQDQDLYREHLPGMTGLWQVAGRSDIGDRARVDLDRTYLESWSVRRNILLLLQTPPAVLKGSGAH